jgi:hypothetical protein
MIQVHSKQEVITIPKTYLDWSFDEDERHNYKFVVKSSEHKLLPSARVRISVIGRPMHQFGTVLRVEEDGVVIHTDEWLDISEEYSLALIKGFE